MAPIPMDCRFHYSVSKIKKKSITRNKGYDTKLRLCTEHDLLIDEPLCSVKITLDHSSLIFLAQFLLVPVASMVSKRTPTGVP